MLYLAQNTSAAQALAGTDIPNIRKVKDAVLDDAYVFACFCNLVADGRPQGSKFGVS
jgi:hypothetical protein